MSHFDSGLTHLSVCFASLPLDAAERCVPRCVLGRWRLSAMLISRSWSWRSWSSTNATLFSAIHLATLFQSMCQQIAHLHSCQVSLQRHQHQLTVFILRCLRHRRQRAQRRHTDRWAMFNLFHFSHSDRWAASDCITLTSCAIGLATRPAVRSMFERRIKDRVSSLVDINFCHVVHHAISWYMWLKEPFFEVLASPPLSHLRPRLRGWASSGR